MSKFSSYKEKFENYRKKLVISSSNKMKSPLNLTCAVPTCKRIKLMVKAWFSLLIYRTFKVFKEAMKYTLFKVTVTRLKF